MRGGRYTLVNEIHTLDDMKDYVAAVVLGPTLLIQGPDDVRAALDHFFGLLAGVYM